MATMSAPKLLHLPDPNRRRVLRLRPNELMEFYHEQVSKISRQARSGFTVVGSVLIQLFNPQGELYDARYGANLVVDAGKAAIIDRLQAASVAVHDYQAIGTGTTAAAAGNTTLETEVARAQGTLSQPTATTDRLITTFAAGIGTGAITETGRLNASSTGNLMARQVFSVINKAAGDSLQVTHDITIS